MDDIDGWSEGSTASRKGTEKSGLQAGKDARRLMPADTKGEVATSLKSGGRFHSAPVEARMFWKNVLGVFCKNMLGVFVQS